jgi:hypothetical protein
VFHPPNILPPKPALLWTLFKTQAHQALVPVPQTKFLHNGVDLSADWRLWMKESTTMLGELKFKDTRQTSQRLDVILPRALCSNPSFFLFRYVFKPPFFSSFNPATFYI